MLVRSEVNQVAERLIPAKTNIGSFGYLVERDDQVFNWHVATSFVRRDCCGNCPTLSENLLHFRAA